MKTLSIVMTLLTVMLMAHVAFAGFARHVGPHETSTAAPPVNPEPTAPLEPVVYNRTVKTPTHTQAFESAAAAYVQQGSPKVGIAFYRVSETMDIPPRYLKVEPYDELSMSVESKDEDDGKEGSVRVDMNKGDIFTAAHNEHWYDVQLVSWSEIQQEVYNALRACGMQVSDPEMITLTGADALIRRKKQGVSQHTAELEMLRRQNDVDILILIAESGAAPHSGLNGRIWDLRCGTLIGADYARFLQPEGTIAGRLLARRTARELIGSLLQQTAHAWAN